MLKKVLAAVGIAGLIVLGGSAAAMAADYPPALCVHRVPGHGHRRRRVDRDMHGAQSG